MIESVTCDVGCEKIEKNRRRHLLARDNNFGVLHQSYYYEFRRGAETWGFHEPPSYPHMHCFLAWRERMESSTEKTLRWNFIVIGDFLNLGSVSHECRQYQFLRDENVTKGWHDFFQ